MWQRINLYSLAFIMPHSGRITDTIHFTYCFPKAAATLALALVMLFAPAVA